MKDSVTVFAPASVSNVGPGFDLMGFALEYPGDVLTIRRNNLKKIRLFNNTTSSIPLEPGKNVAEVAALALLDELNEDPGFDIIFEEKINPGSGIGSSAASSTATVFGINELLGNPLSRKELIAPAMKGEYLASGSVHADNIAPALLGGFLLIRSYTPLDLVSIKPPSSLLCVVVHPDIEVKTCESRKLIPGQISLKDTLQQCGNIAGLVAGLCTEDYDLIGRSLEDVLAEPVRGPLLPGYYELKEELVREGALGCSISGSGPSMFAFCRDRKVAEKLAGIMSNTYEEKNINSRVYISHISEEGTRLTD